MSLDTVGGFNKGIGSLSTGGFAGIFDQILQDSAAKAYMATEGMYNATEDLFENAYLALKDIQMTVPQEQQPTVLAEFLRNNGFSTNVVEQTLGIPYEEVNQVLEAAGFDSKGNPLEVGDLTQNELITNNLLNSGFTGNQAQMLSNVLTNTTTEEATGLDNVVEEISDAAVNVGQGAVVGTKMIVDAFGASSELSLIHI